MNTYLTLYFTIEIVILYLIFKFYVKFIKYFKFYKSKNE